MTLRVVGFAGAEHVPKEGIGESHIIFTGYALDHDGAAEHAPRFYMHDTGEFLSVSTLLGNAKAPSGATHVVLRWLCYEVLAHFAMPLRDGATQPIQPQKADVWKRLGMQFAKRENGELRCIGEVKNV